MSPGNGISARLLRAASDYLDRSDVPHAGPVAVRITAGGVTVSVEGVPPETAPQGEAPAAWKRFTPEELAVLRFLDGREDWTSAAKIAEALGLPLNGEFKILLRLLAGRDVLLSAPSRGYKLNGRLSRAEA